MAYLAGSGARPLNGRDSTNQVIIWFLQACCGQDIFGNHPNHQPDGPGPQTWGDPETSERVCRICSFSNVKFDEVDIYMF